MGFAVYSGTETARSSHINVQKVACLAKESSRSNRRWSNRSCCTIDDIYVYVILMIINFFCKLDL